MNIVLNGKPTEISEEVRTILDLLVAEGLDVEGKGVAVAVDWSVIHRAEWGTFLVKDSAEIEIITARQGG